MDYEAYAEQLIKNLICNESYCKQVNDRLKELLHGELAALLYLMDCGTVSASQISKSLQVNTSRVAAILHQLEKKKYIQRASSPLDRRKTMISITDTGREYVVNRKSSTIVLYAQLLEQLGEEDTKAYLRITQKICELSETTPLFDGAPCPADRRPKLRRKAAAST